MKIKIIYLLIVVKILAQETFFTGVDISSYLRVKDYGGKYYEQGVENDLIDIIVKYKIDFIRLKLWHSPSENYNNLQKVVEIAKLAKQKKLKFLLDIHYSDTWTDPANQTKPAAWKNLEYHVLLDSVYDYTKTVIETLKKNNCMPDVVQIGNEITSGFLWNDGKVGGEYDNFTQWQKFTNLLKVAIKAVNDVKNQEDTVKIMLHIDKGGDKNVSQWFFDNIKYWNVNYDLIGLSYYPWWHGDIQALKENIIQLKNNYGKLVYVVETAYPFTLEWNDNVNNIVGNESQLLVGYPATKEGQQNYLNDLLNLLKNFTNNSCEGLFYWEPGWISTQLWGSPWENLCLFDFNGESLPALKVLNIKVTSCEKTNLTKTKDSKIFFVYPNPFNNTANIKIILDKESKLKILLFSILGKEIKTIIDKNSKIGENYYQIQGEDLSAGVYIVKIKMNEENYYTKIVIIK